jgi:hypothetical protein
MNTPMNRQPLSSEGRYGRLAHLCRKVYMEWEDAKFLAVDMACTPNLSRECQQVSRKAHRRANHLLSRYESLTAVLASQTAASIGRVRYEIQCNWGCSSTVLIPAIH